jgi:hypothetical protein
MTSQQLNQWLELQELVFPDSQMCAYCAQSMPNQMTDITCCCSLECASRLLATLTHPTQEGMTISRMSLQIID